jgi:hypothetical protein
LSAFPTGAIHPGDAIPLSWTRPAGDIEEFEVVLSVDGGEHYTIRVTPELERYESRWTWKVPAIAAEHARLCLRYGRERDEQLSEPSPEFRIVAANEPGTAPDVRTAWVANAGRALDWWDESDAAPAAMNGPALRTAPMLARGLALSPAGVLPRRAPGAAAYDAPSTFARYAASPIAVALAAPPVTPEPQSVPRRE